MATKTLYPVYITKDSSFSGILSANGAGEDYRTLQAWTDRIDIGTIAFDNKFRSVSQACIVNAFRINFQLKNGEEIATNGVKFHCIPKLINSYSLNGNTLSISSETGYGSEGTAEHTKNSWKSASISFFSGWSDSSFIGQNKLLGFYTYVDRPSAIWTTQAYMRNLTATVEYTPRYYAYFYDEDGNQITRQTVNGGSAPSVPVAPAKAGYYFVGWKKGLEVFTGDLPVGQETDVVFFAVYQKEPVIRSSANEGGSISPLGENMVSHGSNVTYKITPDENYYIKDVIVDGISKGEISTVTFENVTSDHNVEVLFSHYCLITINPYENGTVSYKTEYSEFISADPKGTSLKLKEKDLLFCLVAEPDEGYSIKSFKRTYYNPDGDFYATQSWSSGRLIGTSPKWEHSFDVEFVKNEYKISKATDENGAIIGSDSIKYGESAEYTITPNDHYVIKDVLLDGKSVINDVSIVDGKGYYTLSNVETEHTIKAVFQRIVYVNYDLEGNGSIDCKLTEILNYGESTLVVAKAEENNSLLSISISPSGEEYHFKKATESINIPLENLTEDTKVKISFTDELVELIVNQPAEGGYIYGDTQGTYIKSSVIDLVAVTQDGWYFSKWSNGNTKETNTFVIDSDTEISAEFGKYNYAIIVTSNGNGKASANKSSANYNDNVVVTAVPDEGYKFVKWSDGTTDNPKTINVTGNVEISADFTKESYKIVAYADEGGKVIINDDESIGNEISALYEETVFVEAVPDEGCYFWIWSDGVASSARSIIVPAGNVNLKAEFKKYEFSVSIECDEGGTATESQTVQYGDDLKVEISADTGNKISNVMLDGESIYNRLTITKDGGSFLLSNIKGPHIITVFFSEKIYKYGRRLIDYLPPVLQQVLDFIAITNAQQPLVGEAWNDISFVMENQFIDTATEEGVKLWEKELKIIPLKADTLEDRKRRLKALWVPSAKYTYEWLCNWLKVACNDENIKLPQIKDYTVETYLPIKCDYSSVIENMRKYVPANMLINPILRFEPLEHKHFAGMALRVFIKRKIQSDSIEIEEVTTE